MNPKRKGFIWIAGFCAFVLFILSVLMLGVALNDALTKIREVVHEVVESWQVILWETIVLSVLSAILGLYTLWSVIRARKKNKATAILIIVGHVLFLGAAIFVTLILDKLHAAPDITSAELFHLITQVVRDGRESSLDPQFVPSWLDYIQKNDPKCCGIRTYRDWNTFWAPLKDTFPKSCCQPTRPNCITSAREVVYPDLLGQNIKKEVGCYDAVVSRIKYIILESKKFCSFLTVGIGISLAAVLALYLVVFYLKKPRPPGGVRDDDDDSDDDDDGQVPKFPPEQLTWRNLEFYRVLVKRKKKQPKTMDNFGSGSASLEPLAGTSSSFQPSINQFGQQQQQRPLVEYRVDVLSQSTVLPASPATNQMTLTQPSQSIPGIASNVDTSGQDMAALGFSSDTNDDQDRTNRTNVQGTRKPRHRHRHRRDWQENDVEAPDN